jgi:hypothetical protein
VNFAIRAEPWQFYAIWLVYVIAEREQMFLTRLLLSVALVLGFSSWMT